MDPYNESHRNRHRQRRDNHPSFSSTLLDAIYRSIDGDSASEHPMAFYAETARTKQDAAAAGIRRDYLIEKWMAAEEDKKKKKTKDEEEGSDEREAGHRGTKIGDWNRSVVLTNSSSSSSDSSSGSGAGFSSSESESRSRSSTSCYSVRRPKPKPAPIRTSVSDRTASAFDRGHLDPRKSHHAPSQRPGSYKHEGLGFVKTKSKALKIYGDLKKANSKLKQPISPGARLASFLNSIFNVGSPRKAKTATSSVNGEQSTCSSASSFSRSCLSNTPSSQGKPGVLSSGPKQRSVRFFPVISIIVDEPGRQNKDLKTMAAAAVEISPLKAEFDKSSFGNENRRIAEAAREMLRSYQMKKESYEAARDNNRHDEDKDDDAASCASSDLFELDNLSSIGCDQMRYREELPVFETTNLDTNRAIASGLVL